MDRYNLTKGIVENLVNRVKSDNYQNPNNQNVTTDYNRDCINDNFGCENTRLLVVFTGSNFRLSESLRKLSRAKKHGFSYDIAFSFSGAHSMGESGIEDITRALNPGRVYTEEDQIVFDKVMKSVDGIIVPMATQDTTTKLSLGIQDSFISTLLWQSLWHGKKVFMDFYSVRTYNGMKSRNSVLAEMMSDYIEKLERMGVVNLQDNEDYSRDLTRSYKEDDYSTDYDIESKKKPLITSSVERTEINSKNDNQITFDKKVITETDLLNIAGNRNEIVVGINTIITPLALDTAKQQGIKVIRR